MHSLAARTQLQVRHCGRSSCPGLPLHASKPCVHLPAVSPPAAMSRQPSFAGAQRMCQTKAAAMESATSSSSTMDDLDVSTYTTSAINYALNFARASETYQVHPWMLVLGVLKQEKSNAAKALVSLGLDDLYGAWNEVLWALHVCDGLQARPFKPELTFADLAYKIITGSMNFAKWGGRKKVQTEDVLMALAAAQVLEGLFPDLNLSFKHVRAAVEKQTGGQYVLPDDNSDSKPADDENFL